MKAIPIFSSEDSDLGRTKWYLDRKGYARTTVREGKQKMLYAHRIVLGRVLGRAALPSEIADHVNGLKLDNRRENIRPTNFAGNAQNRRTRGFRGANLTKDGTKWRARVQASGKNYFLGTFDTPEEAARVALAKRRELGFLEGAR